MDSLDRKAEKFVESLLSEGDNAACDESVDSFNRNKEELPSFYDEKLFKRGQSVYHENIYSFFGATFFGLVAVLSVPSILKVLISTRASGSDFTAYKRYRATTIYYRMWHDYTFGPGSDFWKTLNKIRGFHNAASKAHHQSGEARISQKDMALTQFGFIGFHLIRSRFFALENVSQNDWKAYIHFWRVIGWLLGIDDRYNICRESVEETKKICQLLVDELLVYHRKQDQDFKDMVRYLCRGLWHINIILNYNVVAAMYPMILEDDVNDAKHRAEKLTLYEKLNALYQKLVVMSMRLPLMRQFWNLKHRIEFWISDHFPIFAILDYGYKNSFVYVLGKDR